MALETELEVIQAVTAFEAKQEAREHYLAVIRTRQLMGALQKAREHIPTHLKPSHPFSAFALWTYYERTHHDPPGETCNYCSMFDGQTFLGSDLRVMFPDYKWDGDDIYPNVHQTLWNRESQCSCLLIREPIDAIDNENFMLWTGTIGTDWKEPVITPPTTEVNQLVSSSQYLRESTRLMIEKLNKLTSNDEDEE